MDDPARATTMGLASAVAVTLVVIFLVILVMGSLTLLWKSVHRVEEQLRARGSTTNMTHDRLKDAEEGLAQVRGEWETYQHAQGKTKRISPLGVWSTLLTLPSTSPAPIAETGLEFANQPTPTTSLLPLPLDVTLDALSIQLSTPLATGALTVTVTVDDVKSTAATVITPSSTDLIAVTLHPLRVEKSSSIGVIVEGTNVTFTGGALSCTLSVEPWASSSSQPRAPC